MDRSKPHSSSPKVLGILQARVKSRRLAGKVMKSLLGEPMIIRQLDRLRDAASLDKLVVAISDNGSDDVLFELLHSRGVEVCRGSLEDVLDRFYKVAKIFNPEHIVRLTADCPLADPQLIDEMVRWHISQGNDYTTNTIRRTFPDGLDAEVLSTSTLTTLWKEATLLSEREHVTLFIRNHPSGFKVGHFGGPTNLSHLRWTVDEPVDFTVVEKIYSALYPQNPAFTTKDILAFVLQNPEIPRLNGHIDRNTGLNHSLKLDRPLQLKDYRSNGVLDGTPNHARLAKPHSGRRKK